MISRINNVFIKLITTSIPIMVFIFGFSLSAQSLEVMEARYSSSLSIYQKEKHFLDSLTFVLNERASLIDIEKGKQKPDQSKIASLMSGAASISNQIESVQKRLSLYENALSPLRKELEKHYTRAIDSLKSVQKISSKNDKKIIDERIFYYSSKRLTVLPVIEPLTFFPEKLLAYEIAKSDNSAENAFYKDYLTNAFNEVNDNLAKVTNTYAEVNKLISLQERMHKFLEEADFDKSFRPRSGIKSNAEFDILSYSSASDVRGESDAINLQASAYIVLLTQLSFRQTSDALKKIDARIGSPISIKDYRLLLKEVKQKLSEFNSLLKLKIDSVNEKK